MKFWFLQTFDEDYKEFQERIMDIEIRLGTILCQAFDDCSCTESGVKVNSLSNTSEKISQLNL